MRGATIVFALCFIAGVFYLGSNTHSGDAGMSLFGTKQSDPEIEHAYVEFIAKYGRSFTSKEQLPRAFSAFSKNYKLVKEHNARIDVTFKMTIN